MLLHLPIAILATLSPIAVSGSVPQFDIAKECRYEGGSTAIFERCSQDETTALAQLRTEWAQFAGSDQKTCMVTTSTGGFASYVELLICLEWHATLRARTLIPTTLMRSLGHGQAGRTRLT